jgi:hypothetical protein
MTVFSSFVRPVRSRVAPSAFLLCSWMWLFATAGAQTTQTFSASADNTIFSDRTDNSNGAGPVFVSGRTQLALRRALLRFNLSSIPSNATITAATLTVYCTQIAAVSPQSEYVTLHLVEEDWGEGSSVASSGGQGTTSAAGDVTWDCAFADGFGSCATSWTTSGGQFDTTVSASTLVSTVQSYTWSSTGMIVDIQRWVNTASSNFGWILIGDESSQASRTAKWFVSKDASGPNTPSLSVTYTVPLPVQLTSFSAQSRGKGILLRWHAQSELNLFRYAVQRHSAQSKDWREIGSIIGKGSNDVPSDYAYLDDGAPAGDGHSYRLQIIDRDGSSEFSPIVTVESRNAPPSFSLAISPTPAKEQATLSFSLADGGAISIRIADALGRIVSRLTDATLVSSGSQAITFDVSGLSPGRYFVIASSDRQFAMQPMIIAR